MQINIEELRQKTIESISDIAAKEQIKIDSEKKQQEEIKKKQQKKANRIIARIPNIIAKSISAGQWSAIVMKMSRKEYDPKESSLPFGAARIVWDECKKNSLKVKADYWYSGDGMDSGYNLLVSWKP